MEGVALKVSMLRVAEAQHARALLFHGCPSIRLAREKLFPGQPRAYGLFCRLYRTAEGLHGWPTVQMILQRLSAVGVIEIPFSTSGLEMVESPSRSFPPEQGDWPLQNEIVLVPYLPFG